MLLYCSFNVSDSKRNDVDAVFNLFRKEFPKTTILGTRAGTYLVGKMFVLTPFFVPKVLIVQKLIHGGLTLRLSLLTKITIAVFRRFLSKNGQEKDFYFVIISN